MTLPVHRKVPEDSVTWSFLAVLTDFFLSHTVPQRAALGVPRACLNVADNRNSFATCPNICHSEEPFLGFPKVCLGCLLLESVMSISFLLKYRKHRIQLELSTRNWRLCTILFIPNYYLLSLSACGLDGCRHHGVLSGRNRAQGHTDEISLALCDKDGFVSGWYRFQGDAGKMMPDQCVPMWRCGTHAPGWLNGSHPTFTEGPVQRQVCFHWENSCCYKSTNIGVRNCGSFFVYELQPTPMCALRYCGNAEGRFAPAFGLRSLALQTRRRDVKIQWGGAGMGGR